MGLARTGARTAVMATRIEIGRSFMLDTEKMNLRKVRSEVLSQSMQLEGGSLPDVVMVVSFNGGRKRHTEKGA